MSQSDLDCMTIVNLEVVANDNRSWLQQHPLVNDIHCRMLEDQQRVLATLVRRRIEL